MNFLITGGSGYLAGRLALELLSNKHNVTLATRSLKTSNYKNTLMKSIEIDWGNQISLERACDSVDVLIHLAGADADTCREDPETGFLGNAVYTDAILSAAIKKGVKRFVYMSTIHAYGSILSGEVSEECILEPCSMYGISKRAGEDIVISKSRNAGIIPIIIRLSNTFGRPGYSSGGFKKLLINEIVTEAVHSYRIILKSCGGQYRDFVPMNTVVKAVQHLSTYNSSNYGLKIYNLGSGQSQTVISIANEVARRVSKKINREIVIYTSENKTFDDGISFNYNIKRLINSGFLAPFNDFNVELDSLISYIGNISYGKC